MGYTSERLHRIEQTVLTYSLLTVMGFVVDVSPETSFRRGDSWCCCVGYLMASAWAGMRSVYGGTVMRAACPYNNLVQWSCRGDHPVAQVPNPHTKTPRTVKRADRQQLTGNVTTCQTDQLCATHASGGVAPPKPVTKFKPLL